MTGPDVTGLDWDVGHDPLTSYEPDVAEPPVGHDAAPATVPAVSFRHRHRVALAICAALLVVLGGGVGVFAYLWNHSGPHQLSVATAVERFGSGASGRITDPGTLRPAAGVYSYTGKAVEHVSLPPKTQTEGPGFPGTISYLRDGWLDAAPRLQRRALAEHDLLPPPGEPRRGRPRRMVPVELRGPGDRRHLDLHV